MKSIKGVLAAIGLVALQPLYASSCSANLEQMNAQISQYGSIQTQGCPFNYYGWGIVSVSDVIQISETRCFARCKYAYNTGSSGRDCTWTPNDWGNTLVCSI